MMVNSTLLLLFLQAPSQPQLESPHAQTVVRRTAINETEPNRHQDSLIIKI